MPFDSAAAQQAGYSEDEILQHLTQTRPFDVDGALKSGYSRGDVISHLAGMGQVEGPQQPPSLSERAGQNVARLRGGEDWQGSEHTNRPLGVNVGRAAIGAIGDTLPIAGAMIAAPLTGGMSIPAAAGLTALGAGGGEAYHQLIQRAQGEAEAPQSSGEAAMRIGKEGAIQGGLTALTQGGTGLVGKLFGSGNLDAAKATVTQAERSNLNPNTFSYAEAADSPGLRAVQDALDKRPILGRILAARRAKDAAAALDTAEQTTRGQVGAPYEKALQESFDSGQQIDTGDIFSTAQELKARLAKEGTELSSGANKLLNRALKFGSSVTPPSSLPGTYVPAAGAAAVPKAAPISISRPATAYEINGLHTEVTDGLMSSDPEVRRVARALNGPAKAAQDQYLPTGTRENYRNFKQDFSGKEGSLQDKAASGSGGMGIGMFSLLNPVTNAAAGVSAVSKAVPLTTKIAVLKALSNGDTGRAIALIERGRELYSSVEDSAQKVSGDDQRPLQAAPALNTPLSMRPGQLSRDARGRYISDKSRIQDFAQP